ncbi:hypothetical protein ACFLYE_02015 [Chloroflexota bacterium]
MERMKSACDPNNSKNGEKGQVLPLVLIVMIIGMFVVAPFLGSAGTSLLGSRLFGQRINMQYSCDSGVEHAIWRLTDDGLTSQLTVPGDSVSYNLGESINGATPAITVCNAWETIASDDFESGGWTGGTGWADNWTHTGASSITTSGSPYQGSYHLMLTSDTGYAARSVDARGPSARLRFYAKAANFEVGETAQALISPDGSNWTAVYTWVDGVDNGIYQYYDIDLSSYTLSSQFWIAFQANMSDTDDYFFVDNLKVVWTFKIAPIIATEDFESGVWTGGTGWLAPWTVQGNAANTPSGSAYEGTYHARLCSNDGYITRSVDLSAQTSARLLFWARVNSFEGSENAQCLVSTNGTDWDVVRTWTDADDDNTYHFEDINLTPYVGNSQVWIAFQANMGNASDYLYLDYIRIEATLEYGIIAKAGDGLIKALATIIDGEPTVVLWWLN